MGKTVALEWGAFMSGSVVPKNQRKIVAFAKTAAGVHMALMPIRALAASETANAWADIIAKALEIADYLCVGVIIFAGAIWMFGNRTKAVELLMGGSIGYLIIRHAEDIRDWLREL